MVGGLERVDQDPKGEEEPTKKGMRTEVSGRGSSMTEEKLVCLNMIMHTGDQDHRVTSTLQF